LGYGIIDVFPFDLMLIDIVLRCHPSFSLTGLKFRANTHVIKDASHMIECGYKLRRNIALLCINCHISYFT